MVYGINMSPVNIIWSISAGLCLAFALIHGLTWLYQHNRWPYFWFSLAALGGAGNALAEVALFRADTIDAYVRALKLEGIAVSVILVSLVWFIFFRFGTGRRWLAWTMTVIWAGVIPALNQLLPYSSLFDEITSLQTKTTPWGEGFSVAVGTAGAWSLISQLAPLGIIFFVADASWSLIRKGNRRLALSIGGGIIFFLVVAGIHAPLVDRGILEGPYLVTHIFMAIILVMGIDLVHQVIRSAELSLAVVNNEERWRRFLENVQLLVAGIDAQGHYNYFNPFFCSVLGYTADELRGGHFSMLIPSAHRDALKQAFQRVFDDENSIPHDFELTMLTKGGEAKKIVWSNVLLLDPVGKAVGALSIGADVTAQREGEESLKTALAEIRELKEKLQAECFYLREEVKVSSKFGEIIGNSQALKYVLMRVEQVAQTDSTVLLLGETGVGKELVARAIHDLSARSGAALIKVNCAALTETLVESELFGHEKGAFTGADRQTRGRFELAEGGTILLDEVGELPPATQAKLLRVLEHGEFQRVGGGATLRVDARIIAATNRNLNEQVAKGRFRQDLFYRLNVYPITVPPLRQRREDIAPLTEYFVQKIGKRMGKQFKEISAGVMEELMKYHWPGNVRELENVIERAVIVSSDGVLKLPEPLGQANHVPISKTENVNSATSPVVSLDDAEKEHILRALEASNWRISGRSGAAAMLQLNPSTLRFRMKKLGLIRSPQTKKSLH